MDSCSLTSPELASKLESNDFETSTCSCSDDEGNTFNTFLYIFFFKFINTILSAIPKCVFVLFFV